MKKVAMQVFAYGLVGVVTLLIDVSIAYMFFHWLQAPAVLASGAGFLSGFFFNFPMNRKKVFHHAPNDRFILKTQIVLYALLSIFNLFATSLLVGWLTDAHILKIQYAKIIVTAVFAVWNFIVFKTVIFSKKHKAI